VGIASVAEGIPSMGRSLVYQNRRFQSTHAMIGGIVASFIIFNSEDFRIKLTKI